MVRTEIRAAFIERKTMNLQKKKKNSIWIMQIYEYQQIWNFWDKLLLTALQVSNQYRRYRKTATFCIHEYILVNYMKKVIIQKYFEEYWPNNSSIIIRNKKEKRLNANTRGWDVNIMNFRYLRFKFGSHINGCAWILLVASTKTADLVVKFSLFRSTFVRTFNETDRNVISL